jgi:hypothetical protein
MTAELDYLAFVDPRPAVEVVERISKTALRDVASAFAETIKSAHDLACLPQYLVTRAVLDVEQETWLQSGNLAHWQERAVRELRRISTEPQVAASLRAVRRAVTTEVWTGFECLANDARDLVAIPGKKATRPRGLNSIAKSYYDLLGNPVALQKIFDDPGLKELAALRHLLVHRSGIVDEPFKREVPGADVIGGPVRLDGNRIMRLANSTVTAGVSLLSYLDSTNLIR